ncbi:MAG: scavenger receptor cysteine-rich domain-containing protein [Archangium sp.]|nr:scavenger receptor cysteine-rich domain-containing protein [Archangium sp.]
MTNAKWMMVGLMLGFSASAALSCGPAVKACGPKECPFGCCDERGSCQVGSSDSQCGAQGNACTACMLAQRCQLGLCTNLGSGGGGGGGGTGGGTGGGITGGGGGVTGGGGGVTGGGTGGGVTGGGTGGGVTGGGTGGGGACGPGNCGGCCRSGSCVLPPNNGNNTTCGSGGGACVDCATLSAICSTSTFSCVFGPAGGGTGGGGVGGGGGTTCTGCMSGTTCIPYSTSSQATSTCGGAAASCLSCTGGLCSAGNCTTSPPTNIVSNGRVRLVDGDGLTSGRLEVFANGGWGQVCDDEFDTTLNGPNVVCRDLGFSGASSQASATGVGDFFLLDDVVCAGTEAQLLSCAHSPLGVENCDSPEAVFITCGP